MVGRSPKWCVTGSTTPNPSLVRRGVSTTGLAGKIPRLSQNAPYAGSTTPTLNPSLVRRGVSTAGIVGKIPRLSQNVP